MNAEDEFKLKKWLDGNWYDHPVSPERDVQDFLEDARMAKRENEHRDDHVARREWFNGVIEMFPRLLQYVRELERER